MRAQFVAQLAPVQPQPPIRLLLTVPEAAAALAIGLTQMWALVARGDIRSVKVGTRARRIPLQALNEYVERLEGPDNAA